LGHRLWKITILSILSAATACANGIVGCTLNATSLNLNQCYSSNTFFTTPLTLDWGTAFGAANATSSNPHDLNTQGAWATNLAGVNVSVTMGSDYSSSSGAGPKLARIDNEAYLWDPSRNMWVVPQFSANPSIHTEMTFDGHFNAPSQAQNWGTGDRLLETYNGVGSDVITFSQGIYAAGLRLSTQSFGFNSNFDATIKAYDKFSNLLGTYVINAQGVGGECQTISNNAPTPCNDAPFIGIRAAGGLASQQIYKIVITATTNGSLDSLLLGSLQFDEYAPAPEPAEVFLVGTGLLALCLSRRKWKPSIFKRR